jgi:type IV secretion system protein VirB3
MTNLIEDADPFIEAVALPLTRPPMYFGVDIKVFVLNGLATIALFIATSSFPLTLICLPIHGLFMFVCQRDVNAVSVMLKFAQMKKAVRNKAFWGARSYSP